jgi:LysM repeat protein
VGFTFRTWSWVGAWRSASAHVVRTGSRFWAVATKFLITLGVLITINEFVSGRHGIDAITQSLKLISDVKHYPPPKIKLLHEGTALELSGGIRHGVADDLRQALDQHPSVKVIHLNSVGGLVQEAETIRELIRSRGLNTYTSEECDSACTMAYLGGKERFLREGARLGFHQPWAPGLTDAETATMCRKHETAMIAIGVNADFARKAMSIPPAGMWRPTPRELLGSHVVTSITAGY